MRLLPLAVLLPGCRSASVPPPADATADSVADGGMLELRTDRAEYRAGDPLQLTIGNRGADTAAFNPCTRGLEQEQGGGWRAVPEPERICTMEAWIAAPGETRTGHTELPAVLAPGRYRVILWYSVEGGAPPPGRREARSLPITVNR